MGALVKLFSKGAGAVGGKIAEYAPKVAGKLVELVGRGAEKVAEKAPDIGSKIGEKAGGLAEKITEKLAGKTGEKAAETVAEKVGEETVEKAAEGIGSTVFKKVRNFGIGLGVAQVGLSAAGHGDLIPNTMDVGKNVAGGMVDATSAITDFVSTATRVVNHVVKGDFGGALADISEFGQNHPVASAVTLGATGFLGRSTALGKIAMVGAAVLGGNHLMQANAEAAMSSDEAALSAVDCMNNMSPIADPKATQPTDSTNAELNDAIAAYTASQQAKKTSPVAVQNEAPKATQHSDYGLGA